MRRGHVTLAYVRLGAFVVLRVLQDTRWLRLETEPTDLAVGDTVEQRCLTVPITALLRLTLRPFEDELQRCGFVDLWFGRFNTDIGHRDRIGL